MKRRGRGEEGWEIWKDERRKKNKGIGTERMEKRMENMERIEGIGMERMCRRMERMCKG